MTDRRKTALILGMTSLFMFSPLAMSLFWHPIPLFQNLGFREGINSTSISVDTRHDHCNRLCFIHNESHSYGLS